MPVLKRFRSSARWLAVAFFVVVALIAHRQRQAPAPTPHERRLAVGAEMNRSCPRPIDADYEFRGVGLDERFGPEFIFYIDAVRLRPTDAIPPALPEQLRMAVLARSRGQTALAATCRDLGVNIRYTYSIKNGRLITTFVLKAADFDAPGASASATRETTPP